MSNTVSRDVHAGAPPTTLPLKGRACHDNLDCGYEVCEAGQCVAVSVSEGMEGWVIGSIAIAGVLAVIWYLALVLAFRVAVSRPPLSLSFVRGA